jgi:hypothetical protein
MRRQAEKSVNGGWQNEEKETEYGLWGTSMQWLCIKPKSDNQNQNPITNN